MGEGIPLPRASSYVRGWKTKTPQVRETRGFQLSKLPRTPSLELYVLPNSAGHAYSFQKRRFTRRKVKWS